MAVKIDSYVVESNVHFPTDYNLLWDSIRKSLSEIEKLLKNYPEIEGWGKISYWKKKAKNIYNQVRRTSHRGGKYKEKNLKSAVRRYINMSREIYKKLQQFEKDIEGKESLFETLKELKYYVEMVSKHIDLLNRRIIKKEKIPHEEKIFSIFEPYTEWVSKGKANRAVELGVKVAIATNKEGFILCHIVMLKQQDVDITVSMSKMLLEKYPEIKSLSFDKGFWSKDNFENLQRPGVNIVMPKKGKPNKTEHEREHTKEFVHLRKKHSAVESDINSLEHHGLNRCPDRSLRGFKRYIALGILSYNLHKLGNLLLEHDRNQKRKAA